jgi:hypothetical protein
VNINSLDNKLYFADFATTTGDLNSNAVLLPVGHTNWIIRKPTATDSTTIYIDSKFTQFTIDGQNLTEANIGVKILIKNNTTMYGTEPVADVDKQFIIVGGAPTASTPYPPNVPGVYLSGGLFTQAYPERGVGDAPAIPPITIVGAYDPGAPWSGTPANLIGQCSPYNYYPSHPYRDSTVIDITSQEYGIYQFVNYQANIPDAGVNRFTLVRTEESINMSPGSIVFVKGGTVGQGQIYILESNNPFYCLGSSPNVANLTLSGVYTISSATTTVFGGVGSDPIGDGLVSNDVVNMYGMLFTVLSVPTDLPNRFIVDKIPQYSKSNIQIIKVGNSVTFNTITSNIEDPLIINDLTVNNNTQLLGNVTMGTGAGNLIKIADWSTLDVTNVTLVGGSLVVPNPYIGNIEATAYVATPLVGGNAGGTPLNGPISIIADTSVGGPHSVTIDTTSTTTNFSGDVIIKTSPSTFGTLNSGSIYMRPGINGGKFYASTIYSEAGLDLIFNADGAAPNGIVLNSTTLANQNVTVDPTKVLYTDQIDSTAGNLSITSTTGVISVANTIIGLANLTTTQLKVDNIITTAPSISFVGSSITNILNLTVTNTIFTPLVQSAGVLTLQGATNLTLNAVGGTIVFSPTGTGNVSFSNNYLTNIGQIQQVLPLMPSTFAGAINANGLTNAIIAPNSPSQFFIIETPTIRNRLADLSLTISTTPAPLKDIIINPSSGIINCSSASLTAVNGVTFATAPATQLTRYYEGTEALTYSGPFTVASAGNIKYTRIGRIITLEFDSVIQAANGANLIITSTAISVVTVRPSQTITGTLNVVDQGVEKLGSYQITAAGVVTIYNGIYGTTFPIGLGNSGFRAFSISYTA